MTHRIVITPLPVKRSAGRPLSLYQSLSPHSPPLTLARDTPAHAYVGLWDTGTEGDLLTWRILWEEISSDKIIFFFLLNMLIFFLLLLLFSFIHSFPFFLLSSPVCVLPLPRPLWRRSPSSRNTYGGVRERREMDSDICVCVCVNERMEAVWTWIDEYEYLHVWTNR